MQRGDDVVARPSDIACVQRVPRAISAFELWKPSAAVKRVARDRAADKCEVRGDGRELADPELYLLIASTLDRLFLRMNPFWATGPGRVLLTAVSSRAALTRPKRLGILRGRPRSRGRSRCFRDLAGVP